jgi:hypothetical protein
VKRSLLLGGVALGGVASLGLAYAKLTSAAPASVELSKVATSATPAVVVSPSIQRTTPAGADVVALSPSIETARLEERRVLYETVDALLQASEFARARKLLDDEQARAGTDAAPEWRDLEQGYRLLADCLERPGPEPRARAEAFLFVSEAHAIADKLRAACSK